MRTSRDVFNVHGVLLHGFDYENQAWVENGKYLRCGHPDPMDCGCFGRLHEGESVTPRVVSIDVLKFPHGISCRTTTTTDATLWSFPKLPQGTMPAIGGRSVTTN
jgi:hypothetical protein